MNHSSMIILIMTRPPLGNLPAVLQRCRRVDGLCLQMALRPAFLSNSAFFLIPTLKLAFVHLKSFLFKPSICASSKFNG